MLQAALADCLLLGVFPFPQNGFVAAKVDAGRCDAHGPFDDPQELNRANLLHLHERHWSADAIGWQPLGWEEWFRAQGLRWDRGTSSLTTNKVGLLVDAALAGEGVILGWQHMVAALLAAGRLVAAHPASVTAGRGNFLRCQTASMQRPAVAQFVEHMLQSIK